MGLQLPESVREPRRSTESATRTHNGTGWATAVLSYNHDVGYVGLVHAVAEAYAERTA